MNGFGNRDFYPNLNTDSLYPGMMSADIDAVFNNFIFTDEPNNYINQDTARQQINAQAEDHRYKCEWVEEYLGDINHTDMNTDTEDNIHKYYLFFQDIEEQQNIWIGTVEFEKL